jgi:hypothetical protein
LTVFALLAASGSGVESGLVEFAGSADMKAEIRKGRMRRRDPASLHVPARTMPRWLMTAVARETGRRVTIGADKGSDTADFIMEARELNAVPHVAQNAAGRRAAIDGRTTRHPGYAASQRIRKRIEEVFGWTKSSAGHRKTKFRGLPRVRFAFTLTAAACTLIRLPKLVAA